MSEEKQKKGRLSNQEMDYIRKNIKVKGSEEISVALGRAEETIIDFAKKEGLTFVGHTPELSTIENKISKELRESPQWEMLKDELQVKELDLFIRQYAKVMAQFSHDGVLPTEETQVFQLIKFEILIHRNLRATKRSHADIKRIETQLSKLFVENQEQQMSDNDKTYAIKMEEQLLSLRGGQQAKSAELIKLSEKHADLLKSLKSSRDQRISKLENSNKNVLSLLKDMQNKEFRDREGKQTTLVNMAAQKERVRLSQPHKFADGTVDRPLLTVEQLQFEEDNE
jgi:hypothetical protein